MTYRSPIDASLATKEKAYLSAPTDPFLIMIVDDSAVIRSMITRTLQAEKDFKVVATAANGQLAIEALRRQPTDVIVLDIEMPVVDGLAAIPQLKAIDAGVQIIMASTLTQKNADISLKALSLGATDYLSKPSADQNALLVDFNRELVEKVRTLGALARRKNVRRPEGLPRSSKPTENLKKEITLRPAHFSKPDIIAIGSSTGGPQALFEIIRTMGNQLPQPILITQHMPPSFTTILAEHITKQCQVICTEGRDGEVLVPAHYYLAPGDFHMVVVKKPEGFVVKLTKDPPENYCRPAVDPMLRSLADMYGKKCLAIILTGMGHDGLNGCKAITAAGGSVIAQDENTSIVWGMPGAVAQASLCSAVLPLKEIGGAIQKIATKVKT